MKRALIPLMLGFGITLALVIGQRLTTDAMAVVLGVAVGVAASVPTSVLLLALLRRTTREANWRPEAAPAAPPVASPPAYPQFAQPNIIVLNPADLLGQRGGQALLNLPQPPPLETLQEAGLRRLRVVGDDEDWR
jgi:hypothetical protein